LIFFSRKQDLGLLLHCRAEIGGSRGFELDAPDSAVLKEGRIDICSLAV